VPVCPWGKPGRYGGSGTIFEAPAGVAGLDDFAVMGQPIEQRGRHLGVAEDARPLGEGQISGEDDRGALVEPADQSLPRRQAGVEEQLAAGLGERQMAEFVEHGEVEPGQIIGEATLPAPWRLARASLSSRLTRSTTV
jgi:hypothetical protein